MKPRYRIYLYPAITFFRPLNREAGNICVNYFIVKGWMLGGRISVRGESFNVFHFVISVPE